MNNVLINQSTEISQWEEMPFPFEHAMAGYIIENPQILQLNDSTLCNVNIIDSEKSVGRGSRADILASYSGEGHLETRAIIELKNVTADSGALSQLNKYLMVAKANSLPYILGVLVAPDFNFDVLDSIINCKVGDGNIYGLKISRYEADCKTIVITEVIYPKTKQKDYTRYELTNLRGCKVVNLSKARLVWQIIYSYIQSNPNITFSRLREIFKDKIQNRSTTSTIHLIAKEPDVSNNLRGRYSSKPISLDDGTAILVSNQWNPDSIQEMIKTAEKLGMKISTQNN